MITKIFKILLLLLCISIPIHTGFAATSGKIVGQVTDSESGGPLAGVNILIVGAQRGSATDLDGEYLILNIPPGKYTVQISSLGYQKLIIENVEVNIDKTTILDAALAIQALQAAPELTIIAKKPVVKRDLTSSEVSVGAEQIAMMPVENFGDVVNLQAGVVNGHFRGGRSSEVAYMVDGVIVSDPYSNSDPFSRTTSNQVENAAIQEVQIVSGTFNAEYGQAMSGIVNVVTKDGDSDKYSGHAGISFGDYISSRSTEVGFYGGDEEQTFMNNLSPADMQDYTFSLSGPVPLTNRKITFFASGRSQNDNGKLYGQNIFSPSDSSNFSNANPDNWYIEKTGNNEFVTLDPFKKLSIQSKFAYTLENSSKLSYSIMRDNMEYQNLDDLNPDDQDENPRMFKYNPEGAYTQYKSGTNHILGWNQALSQTTFYNLNLSYTSNSYKYYVYEDPFDSRYVNPERLRDALNFAYYTGGQGMWHHEQETKKVGFKSEITHQANKLHQLKAGLDLQQYQLTMEEFEINWNTQSNSFEIFPVSSWNHNIYPEKTAESPIGGFPFNDEGFKPLSFSGFLQDKIEYDFMVVNVGLRYDYFHPDGLVPLDYRDPGNERYSYYDSDAGVYIDNLDPIQPLNEDGSFNPWRYKYRDAEASSQISPRIGLAFPLTAQGVVHFSYGHFFQTPPYQYLYENPEFEVISGHLSSILGNAELKPEKTVMYEIGLQQEIAEGVGLNVTGFYKDIRNLLGTEIFNTYDERVYALYVNRDYGNVRGITLALDRRMSMGISASIDYTFQVAEGNSSDPKDVFNNSQSDPPKETEKKVVPLAWDQAHTINGSFSFGNPSDWSIGLIGTIGSGLPYTATPFLEEEGVTNGERKPLQYNLDLKAYKILTIGGLNSTISINIYNVFDTRNENDVFTDTGRATYTLERTQAFNVQGYNTLDDYFAHPEYFSAPRRIKLGISFSF